MAEGRTAATGRHPDLSAVRRGARNPPDTEMLMALMRTSPLPDGPADRRFSSVEDAAETLGLDAERTRAAHRLIGQVATDVRDLLAVAKSAAEAGIPREAVSELIRRGVSLRGRVTGDFIEKARTAAPTSVGNRGLPVGTVRKWGGVDYKKGPNGQWAAVGSGGAKKPAPPAGKPKPAGAKPGAAAPASAPEPAAAAPHPDVVARHARIVAEAKAGGVRVNGDLKPGHTHEHLNELEKRVKTHVAAKAAGKVGAAPAGAGGAPGGAAAPTAGSKDGAPGNARVAASSEASPSAPPDPGKVEAFIKGARKLSSAAAALVRGAPAAVQHFLVDPAFRTGVMKEVATAIRKSPKFAAKHGIEIAKETVHEFTHAAGACKKLSKGETLNGHERKALLNVGVAIAASAMATASPLVFVGTVGVAVAKHTAIAHVSKSLGNILTVGHVGHVGHSIAEGLMHLIKADPAVDEDAEAGTPEADGGKTMDMFAHLILAALAKAPAPTDDEIAQALENNEAAPKAAPEGADMGDRVAKGGLLMDPRSGRIFIAMAPVDLVKAAAPPGGYQPIPGGRHGGFRKKTAAGWDYWYPSQAAAQSAAKHHDAEGTAATNRANPNYGPQGQRLPNSREGAERASAKEHYAIAEAARNYKPAAGGSKGEPSRRDLAAMRSALEEQHPNIDFTDYDDDAIQHRFEHPEVYGGGAAQSRGEHRSTDFIEESEWSSTQDGDRKKTYGDENDAPVIGEPAGTTAADVGKFIQGAGLKVVPKGDFAPRAGVAFGVAEMDLPSVHGGFTGNVVHITVAKPGDRYAASLLDDEQKAGLAALHAHLEHAGYTAKLTDRGDRILVTKTPAPPSAPKYSAPTADWLKKPPQSVSPHSESAIAELDAMPSGTTLIAKDGRTMARKRSDGKWDIHLAKTPAEKAKVAAGTSRGVDENKLARGVISAGSGWTTYTPEQPKIGLPVDDPRGVPAGSKAPAPAGAGSKKPVDDPRDVPVGSKAPAPGVSGPASTTGSDAGGSKKPAEKQGTGSDDGGGAPKPKGTTPKVGAAHGKNEHGHSDDLVPGQKLTLRGRHGGGDVEVLPGGRFRMGEKEYASGHALLTDLHGTAEHKTTLRRYFGLGGERRRTEGDDVQKSLAPLRAGLRTHGLTVHPDSGEYVIIGDLAKARLPADLIPYRGATRTSVGQDEVSRVLSAILED